MIHTSRLLIRPFCEADAEQLHAYLSNPAIYRYEPGEPVSLEQARAIAGERSQGRDFWAVELVGNHHLAGHLYFKQVEPLELLTWELGYIFNPVDQGQGYATESAAALVRYGFENWGVHRVTAHCNPENAASWRVLEKIGMTREGHLRQNIFFRRDANGAPLWTDSFEYGLLQEDLKPHPSSG